MPPVDTDSTGGLGKGFSKKAITKLLKKGMS